MGKESYIGSKKPYVHYTEEQLNSVRNTDMVEFLGRREGFTFQRAGSYYKCVEHNSLVIYPNHKTWVWNSMNLNGLNAFDWLMKVDGYSFKQAADELCGLDSIETTRFTKAATVHSREPPKEFAVPEKAEGTFKQLYMYLTQSRGIDPEIVQYCLHQKILYQDNRNNCVFCGFDENEELRFCELRGTNTEIRFRGNTNGSNLHYSFKLKADTTLEGVDKNRVYVFEAPIDLLSHATLTCITQRNKYGSEYDPNCYLKQNRLSLSGVSDAALEKYLELNPDTTHIDLCLDNDEAGRNAAEKITEKYRDKYTVTTHLVKGGKDYNEALIGYLNRLREKEKTSEEETQQMSNSVKR